MRAIAQDLGLPESTIRYYRDVYEVFLPAIGRGRRRRYPPEVLPLFRLIADGYADNRPRADIERALAAEGNGGAPAPAAAAAPLAPVQQYAPAPYPVPYEQLLATILDGERERREVMWQMAREIVRLGEAIERQQVVLNVLAERLDADGRHTLPPADPAPASADPTEAARLADELAGLRQELQDERELVDRLRRSKLDIERRASIAEAALQEAPVPDLDPPRPGVLRRVLRREDDRLE